MKTLKNLVIASTVALALSTNLYAGEISVGSPVYAGQCDPYCTAYIPEGSDGIVYLVTPAEDNVVHFVANVTSYSVEGGNVEITDGTRVYIYPAGENVEIQSFVNSL